MVIEDQASQCLHQLYLQFALIGGEEKVSWTAAIARAEAADTEEALSQSIS